MTHKKSIFRNLAMVSQLGLSVMAPILLCIAAGVFLDSRFGTRLTFPLLILGFLAGGRNGYVLAKRLIQMEQQEDEQEHGTRD